MLCVLCRRRPVDPQYRPFCSERCQLIDLARWADGDYRIAADSADPAPAGEEDPPD
jgi:endogenous inhibitor of DNA gyrase (YacG/DUF329 family)